jgi:hypothetical protein
VCTAYSLSRRLSAQPAPALASLSVQRQFANLHSLKVACSAKQDSSTNRAGMLPVPTQVLANMRTSLMRVWPYVPACREGINIFLAGFVPTENLRFREESLSFKLVEQVGGWVGGGERAGRHIACEAHTHTPHVTLFDPAGPGAKHIVVGPHWG